MEIICDNHKTHDLKWVFGDQCVACMIESLDNPELTKARKKVVLVYFLKTVRSSCRDEITSLLASNAVIVSRIIQSLVDLACLEGQEVALHPLVGEALMELICLSENVKVKEETITTVSKKLEELSLKSRYFSAMANLLGHLLQKYPVVLPVFLNENGETINLLLQGLTYLDEEVQMSCSFTWFQMLTGLSRQTSEMVQTHSSLSSIAIPALQRVAFDVLFLLDTCDLSEDLELNMLGLLKVLISNSLPTQNILMKVAEHGDGVQIMLVFKKLIRSRRVRVRAGATQCLLVLLRGELCSGHCELVFRADLTEFLFEALSTSSEILISSLLRCLEILAQQETFYSRHFDVYGIESLVRCMDDCNSRHFISPLSHAYKLLVVVLNRHKANSVKLFTDSKVYEHLLDVVLDSAEVSRQFQKDLKIMLGSVVEAFLLLMRTDYLPQAVPLKRISEVASVLIQHATTLPSSTEPPDNHLNCSTRVLNICGKDVLPGDLEGRCMLLVSDLILHQWRILLEVLENDLLDDDAFQSEFKTIGTNPDAIGNSNVFGCKDFFEHLYKSYFGESVSSLMKITSSNSNTLSTVLVDVIASNFLASISTCYQVYQQLLEKYHNHPSKLTSLHFPLAFSRTIVEVSDCEFLVRMVDFKSWSCLSEETKSSVDKVLLEFLKPLLENIGLENYDLINVFVLISEGLHSLEGSLKEMVDEFISMAKSPSLGDDDWHECRGRSRGCCRSLSHGVALLTSLFLYTIDDYKHFIPRRMELIISFIKLISHHQHPPSSSSSPLPPSPLFCSVVNVVMLKFVIHLLTLQEPKEDVSGCVYEAIGDMDEVVESQLSEWIGGELTTVDVWCPQPLKLLNWAYERQLLHAFCEHFLLPRVLKNERTEDMVATVARFEPCLKSIMSIFASSEDKQVLVNVLDLLRTCLVSSQDRREVGRSEQRSSRCRMRSTMMSAAPRMFTQFSDHISKCNKALFINLLTFLNDEGVDEDNDGEQQLGGNTDIPCNQGDSITTQDLKLVSCVESLLEVTDVYVVESDDLNLHSSSLMFINAMLIKSYRIRSKQVFLLLTSTSFPGGTGGKLLHFINSVNSNSFPSDCDADVRKLFLLSLQTLCILLTFHATFALSIGYRLYVHESNVDLLMRPPDSTYNASSRFNDVSEMAVLSQTIRSLFWGLYFMCGSFMQSGDADDMVSNGTGSGFIKILFDECHVREKFSVTDVPVHIVRSVYCIVLNLMASENELLRTCCINCMSAIIRCLDSRDNPAGATSGKLKKHLLNLYWMDYLVKNIFINISSSRSSSIPTSYLKLFDLILHQNPEAVVVRNGSPPDNLVNIKEMPRFMATWFCRDDASKNNSLLLSVMNKIMDKNLLKSDKKLKEQVSEKLKDICAKTSQGTIAVMQDKYTICGVLSRLHKKLQSEWQQLTSLL